MFYLKKITNENEAQIGDRVMVLAVFSGIEAGLKGTVVEIHGQQWKDGGGVTIEWDKRPNHPEDEFQPLRDGFGRHDLEYLAFGTLRHPKVEAKDKTS